MGRIKPLEVIAKLEESMIRIVNLATREVPAYIKVAIKVSKQGKKLPIAKFVPLRARGPQYIIGPATTQQRFHYDKGHSLANRYGYCAKGTDVVVRQDDSVLVLHESNSTMPAKLAFEHIPYGVLHKMYHRSLNR